MKLKNTTDWPNYFVRRMTSWCCRQLGIKTSQVRSFKLRNRSDGFTSGHCYPDYGEICVSLGILNFSDGTEARSGDKYRERTVDELVRVTAHEVAHRMSAIERVPSRKSRRYGTVMSFGGSEKQTNWHEEAVMSAWREQKQTLFALWMKAPARTARPIVPIPQRRHAEAVEALARWKRKLKLAQTKIRKLKRKVDYYEKTRRVARSTGSGSKQPTTEGTTYEDGGLTGSLEAFGSGATAAGCA